MTVTVLRVEHIACGKNHGPAAGLGCWDVDSPAYGTVGPTPREDGFEYDIRSHEFCGTLPEQFDAWWAYEERDLAGYVIGVYEVPEHAVRVGNWQVLFDLAKATRVGEKTCPKEFIPLRRKTLPGAGQVKGWGGWRDWAPSEPTDADLASIEDAAEFFADEITDASTDDDFLYASPVKEEPVYTFTPKRSSVARYSS